METPMSAPTPDLYLHVRVLLGILLGLSITRILSRSVAFVEHPHTGPRSWVHLTWVAWTLLSIVSFWWWEFRLSEVRVWTFESYLFVTAYGAMYYLLAALLFPDKMDDYAGYEAYFIDRRAWIFGVIILITLMDVYDTALKGPGYVRQLGVEYPIRAAAYVGLSLAAIRIADLRFHRILAGAALAYQIVYVVRHYSTLA
jgi:hypothetical protein